MKTSINFTVLLLFNIAAGAQHIPLWNGESPDVAKCIFNNGTADQTSPYSGQWAFKGTINKWKPGIINLKCQGTWRVDLSTHNEIRFYIKSDLIGANLKFGLSGWPYTSQIVDISPYIVNGPLDLQYKLVKIPTQVLKTTDFQLNSVENIRFETSSDADLTFFADEIMAFDTEANKVDSLNLLSNQVIKLNISGRYDMNEVMQVFNYNVTSPDDPEFSFPQFPVKIGRHFYVRDFPEYSTNPLLKNELFLVVNKPLKNGKNYILTVNNVKDPAGNSFSSPQKINFQFNDRQLINHSIKVNQVGYFNWAPKYAYIGNYIGDAGEMPLSPAVFQLKKSGTDEVVLNSIPDFRGSDLKLSGEMIFDCDFSSFYTPGKYYVYVPGIGRSYDFEISEKVLDTAYYTTARGLFYQRCGVAIKEPHADPKWTHGECHLNDGYSHSSWQKSILYNGEPINQYIQMPKGWHDAGDYGKYATPGISALYYLLSIYQFYPEKFADGELNIPESGNGIPDILDEARHELVWLLNMQAADGGVYERVTTLNWPTTMPDDDLGMRYISEKTTNTTGQFSAIMAMASRIFKPFLPNFANQCLNQSKLAMNFLLAHPEAAPAGGYDPGPAGMGGGDYPDPEGDQDERAWAAAELYKATGDLNYRDLFDTYWATHPPFWGWNPFQHHQIPASMAYATTTFPVDENKVNTIKQAVMNYAENTLSPRLENNFYRSACRLDVVVFLGWGAYGQSSRYSWDLIMAYYLTGNEKYKKNALLSLDVQLGNNPQNMTYITGVGSKYPMDPLHHPSRHDGTPEPVPGIPIYGPSAHLAMSNPYDIGVQSTANLYPAGAVDSDPYPALRRFYGISSNVGMSEFNVIDMAITSSVLAFFKTEPLKASNQTSTLFKLNYFKASHQLNQVLLRWETSSEQQISSFTLEKSFDGINFKYVVQVSSKGNSDVPQQYQTIDPPPYGSINYYRLKITDTLGNITYSQTITSTLVEKISTKISLYPNPVSDKINLALSTADKILSEWDLIITDFDGKIVLMGNGNIQSLSDLMNTHLMKFKPGVYILKLKNEQEELKTKFIRN
jgi:hypothetical protein